MKICLLTERMRLGFGVDLVVDEQARRLSDRGFDVTVLVIHADIDLPPHPYRLIVLSRIMPLGDFSSETWVRHALAQCGIEADLWILHTPPFYDWVQFLDQPVVFVEYGAPPGNMFSREIGEHLDAMAANRLEETYSALLPCDAIVSISHSIEQWMPPKAQAHSTVIHLGCDHYPQIPRDQADALRTSLGIEPEDVMLLWVGRMQLDHDEQPYKGFQELLSLMPLAGPHIDRARFVVAGRVSDRDQRTLESRGITVLANLSAEEMGEVFAAADVLINLSKWEGFNLALLEAQIQGTPVIAYDLGPHPEIVRHGDTGLLAKTAHDLFRMTIDIANDRGMRTEMSGRALSWAAKFSWDTHVDQLEQIILSCAANGMPRPEVARLRRTAVEQRRRTPEPRTSSFERTSAKEILELDGMAFVRAALSALGTAHNDLRAMPWLERLNRGASKRDILLEMLDFASARGLSPHVRGLESAVLPARVARRLRRASRKQSASGLSSSPWMRLQPRLFTQHAYRTLLGREAEPAAIAGWVAQLRDGVSRREMLARIKSSEEGQHRPIDDPDLQQILAGGVGSDQSLLHQPAASHRDATSAPARGQHDVQALAAIMPRLTVIEKAIDAVRSQVASTVAKPVDAQYSSAPREPATVAKAKSHVLLVAPGARTDASGIRRLLDTAARTESDIFFGNEVELLGPQGAQRLQVNGPFSHDAFVSNPHLGGVIAVHKSLLERLKLSSTATLTGEVVLDLVSLAHTITYLPVTLCERESARISEGRPTVANVQAYADQLAHPAMVTENEELQFDMRRPIAGPWKVAIVMSAHCDDAQVDRSLSRIRDSTAAGRYHISILRPAGTRVPHGVKADKAITVMIAPDGSTYGAMVNQAIKRAPADCNLVLLLDAGVSPNSPDWLERLAESALLSEVGAVAPKTLYADGTIRHAGMAIGSGEPCGYIARFVRGEGPSATGGDRLDALREVSIVSRHCMMFRRSVIVEQDLLNDELGPEAADIDLCCRLRRAGMKVLVDGRIVMGHPDSRPRWERDIPYFDLTALKAEHGDLLSTEDRFWLPPEAITAAETRTTILPPMNGR